MTKIKGVIVQQQQQAYSLRAQQQNSFAAYHRRCIANYTAYHGCEPDPMMNVHAIYRDYSRPWRKTHIPKVPHANP